MGVRDKVKLQAPKASDCIFALGAALGRIAGTLKQLTPREAQKLENRLNK